MVPISRVVGWTKRDVGKLFDTQQVLWGGDKGFLVSSVMGLSNSPIPFLPIYQIQIFFGNTRNKIGEIHVLLWLAHMSFAFVTWVV